MGAAVPKQFLDLCGKPILRRTMEAFLSLDRIVEMILVLPEAQKEYWKRYCFENGFDAGHVLVSGGITRFHSVQNALKYVEDGAVVAVHDGVRPLVSAGMIKRLFAEAETCPAVVPALPIVESLREISGDGSSVSVDRSRFVAVQTPQVFDFDLIRGALKKAEKDGLEVTDDASAVEHMGMSVKIVEGDERNIKITTPMDLKIGEILLEEEK